MPRVDITLIETEDTATQAREAFDESYIDELAEAYREGRRFPEVVLFREGDRHHVGDGWHRLLGAVRAGLTEIDAEVRPGTKRDALLYATGANAQHGLRRTNADKRRAVAILLGDHEWRTWSDAEIARRVGVSNGLVGKIRGEMTLHGVVSPSLRRGADGRTIDVSGIGRRPANPTGSDDAVALRRAEGRIEAAGGSIWEVGQEIAQLRASSSDEQFQAWLQGHRLDRRIHVLAAERAYNANPDGNTDRVFGRFAQSQLDLAIEFGVVTAEEVDRMADELDAEEAEAEAEALA